MSDTDSSFFAVFHAGTGIILMLSSVNPFKPGSLELICSFEQWFASAVPLPLAKHSLQSGLVLHRYKWLLTSFSQLQIGECAGRAKETEIVKTGSDYQHGDQQLFLFRKSCMLLSLQEGTDNFCGSSQKCKKGKGQPTEPASFPQAPKALLWCIYWWWGKS